MAAGLARHSPGSGIVAQRVRMDEWQAGLPSPRMLGVLLQDVAHARARQPLAPTVPKQRRIGTLRTLEIVFAQVLAQQRDGAVHEGHDPGLPALARETNLGRRIEAHVSD